MKDIRFSVFRRRFLLLTLGAAFFSLLFLYLDRFDLFDRLLICPFHVFGLYCPTCGMTRAAHALLSFDLLRATAANPCLFLLLFVLLWYFSFGLYALLTKDPARFARAGRWPLFFLLGALILWFLIRNILLLFFHIDPLGDFY